MGIELLSDKRALIPRKETEILGKKALELANRLSGSKGKINIIDVCCGSGNLGWLLPALIQIVLFMQQIFLRKQLNSLRKTLIF